MHQTQASLLPMRRYTFAFQHTEHLNENIVLWGLLWDIRLFLPTQLASRNASLLCYNFNTEYLILKAYHAYLFWCVVEINLEKRGLKSKFGNMRYGKPVIFSPGPWVKICQIRPRNLIARDRYDGLVICLQQPAHVPVGWRHINVQSWHSPHQYGARCARPN